ncbi:unnamed protein product [Closterium sp. Naga37s-1]|nr:unnamed protein product [Closterium sp. Naga37s-1]
MAGSGETGGVFGCARRGSGAAHGGAEAGGGASAGGAGGGSAEERAVCAGGGGEYDGSGGGLEWGSAREKVGEREAAGADADDGGERGGTAREAIREGAEGFGGAGGRANGGDVETGGGDARGGGEERERARGGAADGAEQEKCAGEEEKGEAERERAGGAGSESGADGDGGESGGGRGGDGGGGGEGEAGEGDEAGGGVESVAERMARHVEVVRAVERARMVALLRAFLQARHIKTDSVPCLVDEGLYLGSIGAAHNRDLLKRSNVTHVLTVANSILPAHPRDFHYTLINVLDSPEVDLISRFQECFAVIDTAKAAGGCALVHCFAGRSRSVTVVVAYLMARRAMTVDEALALVRGLRPEANPNAGFVQQLREWEAQLREQGVLPPLPPVPPVLVVPAGEGAVEMGGVEGEGVGEEVGERGLLKGGEVLGEREGGAEEDRGEEGEGVASGGAAAGAAPEAVREVRYK